LLSAFTAQSMALRSLIMIALRRVIRFWPMGATDVYLET
jgi:hypothetical protein